MGLFAAVMTLLNLGHDNVSEYEKGMKHFAHEHNAFELILAQHAGFDHEKMRNEP